jgi:hypothetical protein
VNLIPSFSIKFDVLDSGRVGEVKKEGCPLNWNLVLRKKREGMQSGWEVECVSNWKIIPEWPARVHLAEMITVTGR